MAATTDAPVPGSGRWTYVLSDPVAADVHRRLAQIVAFDHAAGAQAVADAAPCHIESVTALEGLGVDRVVLGFRHDNTRPDLPHRPPDGLGWYGHRWAPVGGTAGERWRDIVRRLTERPRLAEVFARHGIALTVPDREHGVLHRARVLLPDTPTAPVMVGYRCCPPMFVPPALIECQPWEFEITLEVLRGTRWEGTGGAPARSDRSELPDRRVVW